MKVDVTQDFEFELREVFNPINLVSGAGEKISICMRDSGFEIKYCGKICEMKNGYIGIIGRETLWNNKNENKGN